MWNDPAIGIYWKSIAPDVNPLLSEKDGKHPAFDEDDDYFDLDGVRVRRKKPCSASRKKPNFDKRKEPKLPELYLLFRVIQAVPLLERPLFF